MFFYWVGKSNLLHEDGKEDFISTIEGLEVHFCVETEKSIVEK